MQDQSGLDALREVPADYSIGRGPVLLAPLVLSVLDVEARVAAFPCETRAQKQCVILSPFADLPAYESCRAGEPYAACLLSERETLPDGDVEEVSWGVVVPCGFMVVARCRQCRCPDRHGRHQPPFLERLDFNSEVEVSRIVALQRQCSRGEIPCRPGRRGVEIELMEFPPYREAGPVGPQRDAQPECRGEGPVAVLPASGSSRDGVAGQLHMESVMDAPVEQVRDREGIRPEISGGNTGKFRLLSGISRLSFRPQRNQHQSACQRSGDECFHDAAKLRKKRRRLLSAAFVLP